MKSPTASSVIEALDLAIAALDTPIKGDESVRPRYEWVVNGGEYAGGGAASIRDLLTIS